MGLSAGGYELLGGSALEVQGRALEHEDRREALGHLTAAATAFSDCGAVWRRDAMLSRLSRLGSPGRRAVAALHGPEALTEREREVARLATTGLTAKEIGERLFIGRRTVESHLVHAYLKLGVSSKRELIRRAEELALRGP
jgi:DNA-binding CsgD family transcriptional regulator